MFRRGGYRFVDKNMSRARGREHRGRNGEIDRITGGCLKRGTAVLRLIPARERLRARSKQNIDADFEHALPIPYIGSKKCRASGEAGDRSAHDVVRARAEAVIVVLD